MVVGLALRDLEKIAKPKDVKRAAEVVEPLYELGDALLARTLVALVYALAAGDSGGRLLLGGDPSRRHDFGLGATDEETRRRLPWQVAAEQVDAGVPWHARGSLLALDVGLSRLALRRIAQDQPSAPPGLMNPADERQFHETLPLLEPGDLSDMDRDAIAGAIARGRARLANATSVEALELVVSDVHSLRVDGLRRRALRWTLVNARPSWRVGWPSRNWRRSGPRTHRSTGGGCRGSRQRRASARGYGWTYPGSSSSVRADWWRRTSRI